MKRKILFRCLLGALLGLAISVVITIGISLDIGDGNYHAITPELAYDCGSEINAVMLQAACSLLYGAVWAGASLIWETERWSLLKMTVTHLLICSFATFPAAYFMHWMDHSISGILLYFGFFLFVYALIWVSQYASMKKKIDAINRKMKENTAKQSR